MANDVKKNSKGFYAYVRSKCKTKEKVGPLKKDDGTISLDSQENCEILNEFYTSVFTDENCDLLPEVNDSKSGNDRYMSKIVIYIIRMSKWNYRN